MKRSRLRVPLNLQTEDSESDRFPITLRILPLSSTVNSVVVRCQNCGMKAKANQKLVKGQPLEKCRECR